MKSIVLFTAAAAGVLVLADRVAGTMWALPFAVVAVTVCFSVDRLTVWRNRPGEVIGRERKRSRVYRTRNLRKVV